MLGKNKTGWAVTHAVPVGWMRQFSYMAQMFGRIRYIPGDVVECGLGEGNTFAMLAYLMGTERTMPMRTLRGFDSFEGFPEPSPFDASPRNPQKGEWSVGEQVVRQRLKESGISRSFPNLDIVITKGFLSESLPTYPDRPIAFLHLDVDLYEGYRDGLEYLFPKVVPGGVVLLDEYKEYHPEDPSYFFQEKWPGCTRAVDQYLCSRSERPRFHSGAKKYYIIKEGN